MKSSKSTPSNPGHINASTEPGAVHIAIDEVCSALIELSDGDAVRLAFELADDTLVVVGTTTAAPGGVLDDERLRLSRQILGVVTDDHRMRRCGDTVSFTARERLRGGGVG